MSGFKISELDHIVLNVGDIERSLQFYTEMMGLKAERHPVDASEGAVGSRRSARLAAARDLRGDGGWRCCQAITDGRRVHRRLELEGERAVGPQPLHDGQALLEPRHALGRQAGVPRPLRVDDDALAVANCGDRSVCCSSATQETKRRSQFSTGSAMVLAQYYNLIRFGRVRLTWLGIHVEDAPVAGTGDLVAAVLAGAQAGQGRLSVG